MYLMTLLIHIQSNKTNNCFFFSFFFRYIKEWAEYKKTDAYKEFRRQQMEQKDPIVSKKVKQNLPENPTPAGNIIFHHHFYVEPTS